MIKDSEKKILEKFEKIIPDMTDLEREKLLNLVNGSFIKSQNRKRKTLTKKRWYKNRKCSDKFKRSVAALINCLQSLKRKEMLRAYQVVKTPFFTCVMNCLTIGESV